MGIKQYLGNLWLIKLSMNKYRHFRSVEIIKQFKKNKLPIKLIIGASGTSQQNFISTNFNTINLLDSNTWKKYFSENSIDNILAEHVWEHLTLEEGTLAIQTCLNYLKIGGNLRIAVPDSYHPSSTYREMCKPRGSGVGAKDHKIFYNIDLMDKLLQSFNDFIEISYKEYYSKENILFTDYLEENKGKILRTEQNKRKIDNSHYYYSSLILDIKLLKKNPNILPLLS